MNYPIRLIQIISLCVILLLIQQNWSKLTDTQPLHLLNKSYHISQLFKQKHVINGSSDLEWHIEYTRYYDDGLSRKQAIQTFDIIEAIKINLNQPNINSHYNSLYQHIDTSFIKDETKEMLQMLEYTQEQNDYLQNIKDSIVQQAIRNTIQYHLDYVNTRLLILSSITNYCGGWDVHEVTCIDCPNIAMRDSSNTLSFGLTNPYDYFKVKAQVLLKNQKLQGIGNEWTITLPTNNQLGLQSYMITATTQNRFSLQTDTITKQFYYWVKP